MMARITADRLVRHPRESDFVLMRQPSGPAPTVMRSVTASVDTSAKRGGRRIDDASG
jgi:hypothetical protein